VYVGQLEGVSPSTAALGLIYEKGPISANVQWDYAGKFVAQTFTEIPGVPAISDPFSWVTAQASYEIVRNFKVYVSAKNLLDSVTRTFLGGNRNEIWASGTTGTGSAVGQGYSDFGRTFTAGATYKF
jgi:outer membrane receptor protein involved in Fe transport